MHGPLVIPEGFNAWKRLDQINYYLDQGLKIHPCYGPLDKCDDPGKKPRWTVEQRLSASRNEVLNHFRKHPTDNVGMVPCEGQCMGDTDALDPTYKDTPIAGFRTLFGDLYNGHPFASTWRGDRIPLFVPDVDPSAGKLVNPQVVPGLSIEVFLGPKGDTANVILPPSVHEKGHRYAWEGYGEALTLSQSVLITRFGLAVEKKATGPAPQTDRGWKRAYRGDLRTLDIEGLCHHLDIFGQSLSADDHGQRGGFTIKCPWASKHTDKGENWSPSNTSTAIFFDPQNLKSPGFRCFHTTYCQTRTIKDFLEWCETQEADIVDRFCARQFRPQFSFFEETGQQEEQEEQYPQYVRNPWPPSTARPEDFKQGIFYPQDSILEPFMEYGRQRTEGSDAYLLGTGVTICSSLVARRVWIDFGEPLYFNLFALIVGKPSDRKSFTIKIGRRIAQILLGPERFLSPILSYEGLFDEYALEEGGHPDKVCIVDDAAMVLSTWRTSCYGERVADQMLRLYDCLDFSESFRRNKNKENNQKAKRSIPDTSTNLLFGATFADALFGRQKSQQGLARRFHYYLSCEPERIIEWPPEEAIRPIADKFKSLLIFDPSSTV